MNFRKHATKLSNSSVTLSQYEKLQDELDNTRKDVKTANRERDAAIQEKVFILRHDHFNRVLESFKFEHGIVCINWLCIFCTSACLKFRSHPGR